MKKRLAKKALSMGYYNVWFHPETGRRMLVPRNARCWGIILRACSHFGHPSSETVSDGREVTLS